MVPDVFIYLNTGGDCIYLCKIPVVTVVTPDFLKINQKIIPVIR